VLSSIWVIANPDDTLPNITMAQGSGSAEIANLSTSFVLLEKELRQFSSGTGVPRVCFGRDEVR